MNQETFTYSYSAKRNSEVLEIRKKYLPQEESKLEELKRLDNTVQTSGMTESLSTGIVGVLVFGLGLCLAMQVIVSGQFFRILGIVVGIIGSAIMLSAYPIYRKVMEKAKDKYAPRILELTEELSKTAN